MVEGFDNVVGQSQSIATHAGVFMVQGLTRHWKQPVGYFLSASTISPVELLSKVLECVRKIQSTGLVLKLFICDQGSNNRSMLDQLGVSIDNPYFCVNSSKIFVTYDPPHLIKNIRNNMKNHGYKVDGQNICWSVVEKFYEVDAKQAIRFAPNLTQKHIKVPPFCTMKVYLATQVLTNITNTPDWELIGRWSNDGKHIYYGSNKDGNWELYRYDLKGQSHHRLTNNDAFDGDPRVIPRP